VIIDPDEQAGANCWKIAEDSDPLHSFFFFLPSKIPNGSKKTIQAFGRIDGIVNMLESMMAWVLAKGKPKSIRWVPWHKILKIIIMI